MFKKLTAEEFDQLRIKGWGRSDPTYNAILGLRAGEAVFIPKAGWRSNKTPSTKCRRIEKKWASMKIKYKCVALADNSGWAVKRLSQIYCLVFAMTAGELEKKFESEFAASITDGMMWGGAFPKEKIDAVTYSVEPEVKIDPAHHQLIIWRPLIMDHRTLPKTFLGFKVDWLVRNDSIPEELRADEEGLMHYDECWSEERVIAYVREHAIDICEKLNDYTLTEKELCDIIAGGDFERLKKDVAEERAARLNGEYDDFEDFDEDDFDDIDEEPPR